MNDHLNNVLTASEAENMYNLSKGRIRKDIEREKFSPDEYRKAGSTWILLKAAVENRYKIKNL